MLTLLRDWGVAVEERAVSIDEVMQASDEGRLGEMWGTGTAAVISPVGELGFKERRIEVNGGRIGALTRKLYDTLSALHDGRGNDEHGWLRPLD